MPLDKTLQPKRTSTQNKAIHLYLEQIARELTNMGETMQNVVKKMPAVEITPSKESLKIVVWKPIQEAMLGKKSTTELTTAEVSKVYEIVSMFLAKQFKISIPFPDETQTDNYLKSYEHN